MATTVDWGAKIISVLRADMTLIQSSPTEIRELDLNSFRLDLKALEAGEEGMPFLDTHQHNTEVTLGGITYARLIEIINGYTITFEDGQYAVNLVGANSNVGDETNVNQVSIRTNNSAGLISTPAIEFSSFNGGVTIDITKTTIGTAYNLGTPANPVGNLDDALLIASSRGLTKLFIIGNITFVSGDDISDFIVQGQSDLKSLITVDPGVLSANSEFNRCTLQGTLNSDNFIRRCILLDISFPNGIIAQCALRGTITLTGGISGSTVTFLINCTDSTPGGGDAISTIDMGGAGNGLLVRNYSGGLELINKTGTEEISIGIHEGRLLVDSTVTNGEILVRITTGELTDNSTGSAVVIGDSVMNPTTVATETWDSSGAGFEKVGTFGAKVNLIERILRNKLITDPVAGVMTLFDDSGGVLLTANLFEDAAGTQTYQGKGAERRERLE